MLSKKYEQQRQPQQSHNAPLKQTLARLPPHLSLQPHPQHPQQPGGPPGRSLRRQRKSNFSNAEVEILVREVAARRGVLFGARSRSTTVNGVSKTCEKMGKWREIAVAVNSADFGEKRTVREVRKKWENVVSSFRRKIRQPNLLTSLIGGGRSPADEALACANAYCGPVPQPQLVRPPQQPIPQLLQHQRHQQHHQVYEPQGCAAEDLEDGALLLQPEVQIDAEDTPMQFEDSKDGDEQEEEEEGELCPRVESVQSLVEEGEQEEGMDMRQIEVQKLQVMRELLDVETKRLKVERKRLKVERMRLQIELQNRANPSAAGAETS